MLRQRPVEILARLRVPLGLAVPQEDQPVHGRSIAPQAS
jgi:hypothetical protein